MFHLLYFYFIIHNHLHIAFQKTANKPAKDHILQDKRPYIGAQENKY